MVSYASLPESRSVGAKVAFADARRTVAAGVEWLKTMSWGGGSVVSGQMILEDAKGSRRCCKDVIEKVLELPSKEMRTMMILAAVAIAADAASASLGAKSSRAHPLLSSAFLSCPGWPPARLLRDPSA